MNNISNDESVQKLCDSIVSGLRDDSTEKVDQLLKVLKIICGRPSICASSLPPEDTLIVLIRSRTIREYFRANQDHCARLVGLFLSFTSLNDCTQSCLKVLLDCLTSKGEHAVECSKQLSGHPDFGATSVELAEIVFKCYPIHFERQLLLVYSQPHPNIFKIWAKWSAESAWFFQKLTSLLNATLQIGPTNQCLRLIDTFVRLTEIECESLGRDFVSLYPQSVQHLVTLMQFLQSEVSISVPKEIIDYFKREYSKLKHLEPSVALVLLTHFKDCNKFL